MAKVIGFEKRWSRGSKGRMGRYIYYPVFSYKVNGEEIEVEHTKVQHILKLENMLNLNIILKIPVNII